MELFRPGKLEIGSNYLASHAGLNMWKDWRPDIVQEDFARFVKYGISILRVIPIWPDFQPISALRTAGGGIVDYAFGEDPLPDTECGQAGMSEESCTHFEVLCDIAEKCNLKMIVGLLAGWMSGRLYVPPALEGLNLYNDPVALMWQNRFLKYFVNRMKCKESIAAWDLGNECNCMSQLLNRETAYAWSAATANAIRAADNTRPVVSGMHSLLPEGEWTIQDQAEITDILTIHPYPLFTPYCDLDPINTTREGFHATAESRMYADIGGKPCIVEETGNLGPMNGNADTTAGFVRTLLFSAWANDCRAVLWWCGVELNHLDFPPYDWFSIERELGLFDKDKNPKAQVLEFKKMRSFLDSLPFDTLPQRIIDGVCILTHDQEHWPAAFGSYILAKQSGLDLEFQYADQPLKDSGLYFMPCVNGSRIIDRRRYKKLLEKVSNGAVLYISMDSAFFSEFEEVTGIEVVTRTRRSEAVQLDLGRIGAEDKVSIHRDIRLECKPTRAEVLGTDSTGSPVFTRVEYGKGVIYILLAPLETYLAKTPGAFESSDIKSWKRIYQTVADDAGTERAVVSDNSEIGITEHIVDKTTRIIVAINYTPKEINWNYTLTGNWRLTKSYCSLPVIPANDAAVFEIKRDGVGVINNFHPKEKSRYIKIDKSFLFESEQSSLEKGLDD